MHQFNLNNKKFKLVQNSENGKVDSQTIFEYKQDANLVTADYFGGTIKYGKIIALLDGNKLDMLYQCITEDFQLKAGKAKAEITIEINGKLKLILDWEWLTEPSQKGKSEYIEI